MVKPTLLTPAQVAAMLGVSPITVRSWTMKGWLRSVHTPGGHRRFLQADLDKLKRERGGVKSSSPVKVLIVDDDDSFRNFLVDAIHLMDPSMEIKQAEDGFRSGMILSEFMPDIVLLDYDMPALNGAQVCRQIKSNPLHVQTRVIGITGYANQSTEDQLLDAGAEMVLRKPFEIKDLMAVLNEGAAVDNRRNLE